MLRTFTYFAGLLAIMAAITAGELVPWIGGFLHEINPIIAFFLYLGLGYITASRLGSVPSATRTLIVSSLLAHLALYSTPFVVGYYTFPAKVANSMAAEGSPEVSYSEAATAIKVLIERETSLHGIPAYALYSERLSLTAASLSAYIAKQCDDIDDLGGLLTALLNIVLHTIPIGLKWLLTDKLMLVHEPGYIGLIFWYLASLGFYIFGFLRGES